LNAPFENTRTTRAEIRRLAGTMPSRDISRRLGISRGTLRNLASEMGISLRFGPDREVERPAADDRAVARIDATKARTIELNGIIVSAEVAQKLTVEATERGTSLRALVAQLMSYIAIDGMTAAVLDDR